MSLTGAETDESVDSISPERAGLRAAEQVLSADRPGSALAGLVCQVVRAYAIQNAKSTLRLIQNTQAGMLSQDPGRARTLVRLSDRRSAVAPAAEHDLVNLRGFLRRAEEADVGVVRGLQQRDRVASVRCC